MTFTTIRPKRPDADTETARFSNRRLDPTKLRQRQRLEIIGALAGGAAHEFNNLLQSIRGYIQFAAESLPEDGQPAQDLQVALEVVDRGAHVTRQLLRFSRQDPDHLASFDINEVVRDQVKMLRPLLGEAILLEFQANDDPIAIIGDRGAIEQVIMNLCLNAKDAMPGGGRLTLSTQVVIQGERRGLGVPPRPNVRPGPYVKLTVADTGCGIPEEIRHRVFEPLFTTKDIDSGTGLGLAFVDSVAQHYGGAVEVQSHVGEGSRFEVYLPVAPVTLEPPPAELNEEPVRGGSETILIAEDDMLVRQFIERTLSQAGYTTVTAADGEQAVMSILDRGADVSLIVADSVMPRCSGLEAVKQIRTVNPGVQAIFLTGYAHEERCIRPIREAGFHVIEKPFHPRALLQEVRRLLDQADLFVTSGTSE